MPKIPIIKAKDFRSFLIKYGCVEVSVRSSHHKITNPATGMTSIIAIHSNKDLDKGAFSSSLKQLGIDVDKFIEFIE